MTNAGTPSVWKERDGSPYHGMLLLTPKDGPTKRVQVSLPMGLSFDDAVAAIAAEQAIATEHGLDSHPWIIAPTKPIVQYEYTRTHSVCTWGDGNKTHPQYRAFSAVPAHPGEGYELHHIETVHHDDGSGAYVVSLWTWKRPKK